jgi:hypothetical protein
MTFYLSYSTKSGGWQGLVALTQAPTEQIARARFQAAFGGLWFFRFSLSSDDGYLQSALHFPLPAPDDVGVMDRLPPELIEALARPDHSSSPEEGVT